MNIHKYERIIDTSEKFREKNPILKNEVVGFERDTRKFKMGDGTTPYNDLPYLNGSESSSSGNAFVEKDIAVMGVTVGNYKDGDVITEGTTLTEVLSKMMQKRVLPTYKAPVISLTVSPSADQEISKEVTFTITPSFTKNDAGDFEKCEIYRNGTLITTLTSLSAYVDTITPNGNVTYKVVISYKEGAIKKDNFGDEYSTGHITAGNKNASKTVNIVYPYYYGVVSDIDNINAKDLTKDITVKKDKDYSYTGVNVYAVILYDADHGSFTSILDGNGFECISGFTKKSVTIGTKNYTMYYTNDKATITDFHYIFKY